ncbi:glycosyltransferase family 2 protein [Geotalea uraniireducens]|uniref:Glycosyl transferase, family 2 n=1 Tax=Geotalea uraniireducens (strain Rf4) TaxID=351605 RepID=A5GEM2_GEOUR|nr:glycosyltransferase family A protein [Geotalea uraniireducens]ABQ25877.1 glycosyl transferase, family 2 [Geotalea uraniireducens Rf4]
MTIINRKSPSVSIILPVFNGEKYLQSAIESLLSQSYADFELIIINDGSTDQSLAIMTKYSICDKRIRILNQENKGLIYALNKGIDLSRGEYIARMDSDDISHPDRLKHQVAFLERNRDVGIVGTYIDLFDEFNHTGIKFATKPEEIRAKLLFGCELAHPTVMIRKVFITKYDLRYDINDLHAEDFGLWVRCCTYFNIANVPKILVRLRQHNSQVTKVYGSKTIQTSMEIILKQLLQLGITVTPAELSIHTELCYGFMPGTSNDLISVEKWLLKLFDANKITQKYNSDMLSKIILHRWYIACIQYSGRNLRTWRYFYASIIFKQLCNGFIFPGYHVLSDLTARIINWSICHVNFSKPGRCHVELKQ